MRLLLVWMGRLSGAAGVLVSAVAVLARMSGSFHVGGFEAATLLQAGIAAMVAGCLSYVASLAEPGNR
jgi:hypothetical protein